MVSHVAVDEEDLAAAAKLARLDHLAERSKALLPIFDGVMQLLEMVDMVDVGETAPASAFDARWSRQP